MEASAEVTAGSLGTQEDQIREWVLRLHRRHGPIAAACTVVAPRRPFAAQGRSLPRSVDGMARPSKLNSIFPAFRAPKLGMAGIILRGGE